ncbi:SOUL heme-binding protein [Helicosporidium sp. ATCC 50920]|nr:SOUL heme-binding protein [Helicosporidium sp. ATCC 50920]|eukprot:KDD76121.1 SOUL heme-binding protein [Helicosporidium sp. ATCC 50920]
MFAIRRCASLRPFTPCMVLNHSCRAFSHGVRTIDIDQFLADYPEENVAPEKQRLLQVAMVSAVSQKTNTTTVCQLGAFTENDAQVILYDTPGVVGRECVYMKNVYAYSLEHYMNPKHRQSVESAWITAGDCDLMLYILDAERQLMLPDPRVERLIGNLSKPSARPSNIELPPTVLIMNKIDLIPEARRSSLDGLEAKMQSLHAFQKVFRVSALKGLNFPHLKQYLLDQAPLKEWLLPSAARTDRSDIELAREVTREKIFRRYHAELPYEIVVAPQEFKRLPDGTTYVAQNIYVKNENIKKILMGTKASAIKTVFASAQHDMENLWAIMFLKVFVVLSLMAGASLAIRLTDPTELVDHLSAQTISQNLQEDPKPDFCGDYECQTFEVACKTDNYEVRKYPKGKYVITSIEGGAYTAAYAQAVYRLSNYFKGDNDEGDKFELTTPLVLHVKWSGDEFEKTYSFGYWLPEDKQEKPPAPKSANVKIKEYSATTFFVKVFGGFATEENILKQAKALRDLLKNDEKDYNKEWLLAKSYDRATTLTNRHNEIAIPSEDDSGGC